MPPRSTGRPGRARRGVTLLELLVVLLLVGFATALVAPALARSASARDARPSIARVVDAARSAAVRRGETLALDVSADGRWTLVVAHADSLPIAGGRLSPDAAAPRRLLVTPLGLCLPDGVEAGPAWDAAACRPFGAPDTR